MASGSSAAETAAVAARLLGVERVELEALHRGGNSRVYRATYGDGDAVVKQVYRQPDDPRRRDETEVAAFRLLHRLGLDRVPAVLAHDSDAHVAVYEHVDGQTFPPAEAAPADVDAMADFVVDATALRNDPEAASLALASEATLSLDALAAVVERRIGRLRPVVETGRVDLATFLAEELEPARRRAEADARAGLAELDIGPADETPRAEQVLSPSDLGFHNALRASDGRLVLVDFEYFGWDDPAKLVSDFLLHPAMQLAPELRQRFARRIVERLAQPSLEARIDALHPLHAIRWALIVLNEFLPQELDRRRFAGAGDEREQVLARQLEKARKALEQVDNRHAVGTRQA